MKKRLTSLCSLSLTASGLFLAAAFGWMIASTGCSRPRIDCDDLCKKIGECSIEIGVSTGKIPKSMVRIIKANDELRKRTKERIRKECKRKCNKNNKRGKWSRNDQRTVRRCINKKSCKDFARCIKKKWSM